MKKYIALIAATAAFTGCQTLADHNAKTRADQEAGRAAAAQAKTIAAAALEAVKGIKPTNSR